MLTEFSHKIIFPWGQDRWVKQRRRAVYPSNGDVHMRCGNCGTTDFTVHVKVGQMGAAKVTILACSLCGKTFPINEKAETGGSLTMGSADSRKREQINANPDN